MKILIYEFFCAQDPFSPAIREGKLMLVALADCFLKNGYEVITVLNPELETGSFQKTQGLCILKGVPVEEAADKADAFLVIAPEAHDILYKLTLNAQKSGKLNLGATPEGIKKAANKYITYQLLKDSGLDTPQTWIIDTPALAGLDQLSQFKPPFVIKPVDGYASTNVYLIKDKKDIQGAAGDFLASHEPFLVQEFIEGKHMSVTLLSRGKKVLPLSLNSQHFNCFSPFFYTGGTIGLNHPLRSVIFNSAITAWNIVGGLNGLGGVDLVVGKNKAWVIEINPRPTSPITAIISNINSPLKDLLPDALVKGMAFDIAPLSTPVVFEV